MPIHITNRSAQREGVIGFLQSLMVYLPEPHNNLPDAWTEANLEPAAAGRIIGEYLSGEFGRLDLQIAALERHNIALMEFGENLLADYKNSAAVQARSELEKTRQTLLEAQYQLRLMAESEAKLRHALVQQSVNHERDIKILEHQLADARRLIARQHLELVDVMGDGYSQSIAQEHSGDTSKPENIDP